jgi:hypothetical protein
VLDVAQAGPVLTSCGETGVTNEVGKVKGPLVDSGGCGLKRGGWGVGARVKCWLGCRRDGDSGSDEF